MSRSRCGQAGLAQSHLPGPWQHFSIHLSHCMEELRLHPSSSSQRWCSTGQSPHPPLQCSTSPQWGTWYLCQGIRLSLRPRPWLPSSALTCWTLHPPLPRPSKMCHCLSSLSCPGCLYLLEKLSWASRSSLWMPGKQIDVERMLIALATWQNTNNSD